MKKLKKLIFPMIIIVLIFSMTKVEAKINPNIMEVYQYDSNNCNRGIETTCKSISPSVYDMGTIVRYKVNDIDDRYFFVLHDDGETITMQQRGNTISGIAWNENYKNSVGPETVLKKLEEITSTWTNVNNQTYEIGKTIFKDNAYTGCLYTECNSLSYTLPIRTAKARLITMQEVINTGCTGANKSCPIWMYNYLYNSSLNGATVSVGNDIGYWTSSVNPDYSEPWYIDYYGNSKTSLETNNIGARAVVVIDKEVKDENIETEKSNNNGQVVEVGDTLKKVNLICLLGTILFIIGIIILVQNFLKKKHN